jgi:hypothetical protein
MSDLEKLNPKGILGRSTIDAAAAAHIFGYQIRVVKLNGLKAISDEKLRADGYNPKRWDVGVVNDTITELWIPQPPQAQKK